jgi:hypothetical protein
VTLKLALEVALPPGVVTLSGPLVAPAGTTAVSWLSLTTVKLLASVPPTATLLALVNPLPERVTLVPTAPLVGVKLVRVGAGGGEPPPWPVPSTTLMLSSSLLAATRSTTLVAMWLMT